MLPSPQELRSYLSEGVPLEHLWEVARGQTKYADFAQQHKQGSGAPAAEASSQDQEPALPDDLVWGRTQAAPVVSHAMVIGSACWRRWAAAGGSHRVQPVWSTDPALRLLKRLLFCRRWA